MSTSDTDIESHLRYIQGIKIVSHMNNFKGKSKVSSICTLYPGVSTKLIDWRAKDPPVNKFHGFSENSHHVEMLDFTRLSYSNRKRRV